MTIRLTVFDFDGTLFASPMRPDWWPWTGFWGRPESLSPPYVPEVPGAEWWASDVVEAARQHGQVQGTFSVMMTGRPVKLRDRIDTLLASQKLRFDRRIYAGDGATTLESKLNHFTQLVRETRATEVEVWEDRFEHTSPFETHLWSLGVTPTIHLVERVTRPFAYDPTT